MTCDSECMYYSTFDNLYLALLESRSWMLEVINELAEEWL